MSTLVSQTVTSLVSLAAFAFLLDGCLRLLLEQEQVWQANLAAALATKSI